MHYAQCRQPTLPDDVVAVLVDCSWDYSGGEAICSCELSASSRQSSLLLAYLACLSAFKSSWVGHQEFVLPVLGWRSAISKRIDTLLHEPQASDPCDTCCCLCYRVQRVHVPLLLSGAVRTGNQSNLDPMSNPSTIPCSLSAN